jgi:hypothetical protein
MTSWTLYDYLMAFGGGLVLIAIAIHNRLEYNYFTKHRKELTALLYGGDPFGTDRKLSWSDRLIMGGAIYASITLAWWAKKYHKNLSGRTLAVAPNILNNNNYFKLYDDYVGLRRLTVLFVAIMLFFCLLGFAIFIVNKWGQSNN